MNKTAYQLDLFQNASLNPTYEIKRQLRLTLAGSKLSRDEVVDQMNAAADQEGVRQNISKSTLENWVKDSAPDRMPSLLWMTIFCKVMDTIAPISAMIRPLGADIIGQKEAKLLIWARAQMEKKRATKRARLAEQALEDF